MTVLHLGERDARGLLFPACGADAQAPVVPPEDLKRAARQGQPVCDHCVAIATAREAGLAESALNSKT